MTAPAAAPPRPRLWTPKRVLVTAAAAERPHTAEILRRCEQAGVAGIEMLAANRLPAASSYAEAKGTLAVVVAPPSALKPQPIPPSADWRIDLARGCPAHCQYCYLAGSLQGPPITRVYANVEDVLAAIPAHVGRGTITTGTAERGAEGTTFEASCYTDPLGIEHLTGSLAATIAYVGTAGTADLGGDVQLRFTTKFDAVDPLLDLPHGRRTRIRFSVNAAGVADRFEGGAARMPARLAALRRAALAGYRIGLTVAPIMPVPGWKEQYAQLFRDVAAALERVPDPDLTVELITHRFTPRTKLDLDEATRRRKTTKFGGAKYVYPAPVMSELRSWFDGVVAGLLPGAR